MYFLFASNDGDSTNSIKVYCKHLNNGQYGRFSRENFSHKVPSKADSNRRENDFRKFADTGVKPWKKVRREKIIWKPSSAGQSWPTQWGPRISIREAIYPYLNAVSFLPLIFHIHAFAWSIERTWSIE